MTPIPLPIAERIRTSLRASLGLVEHLATQGYVEAAHDRAELVASLIWLDSRAPRQRCKGIKAQTQHTGKIVHEGQRWPAFGTHRKRRR